MSQSKDRPQLDSVHMPKGIAMLRRLHLVDPDHVHIGLVSPEAF